MENLAVLLFDIILWIIYIAAGLISAMLIQLISYRIFKFNLYKWLKNNLINKELKK